LRGREALRLDRRGWPGFLEPALELAEVLERAAVGPLDGIAAAIEAGEGLLAAFEGVAVGLLLGERPQPDEEAEDRDSRRQKPRNRHADARGPEALPEGNWPRDGGAVGGEHFPPAP